MKMVSGNQSPTVIRAAGNANLNLNNAARREAVDESCTVRTCLERMVMVRIDPHRSSFAAMRAVLLDRVLVILRRNPRGDAIRICGCPPEFRGQESGHSHGTSHTRIGPASALSRDTADRLCNFRRP
jgi:hypothetical protein